MMTTDGQTSMRQASLPKQKYPSKQVTENGFISIRQDPIRKAGKNLHLNVVSKKKGAYWVSVDGENIPRFLIRDAFDEAKTGWYYDMTDRIVKVKCKKPQKDDFEIVVKLREIRSDPEWKLDIKYIKGPK